MMVLQQEWRKLSFNDALALLETRLTNFACFQIHHATLSLDLVLVKYLQKVTVKMYHHKFKMNQVNSANICLMF